jgi:hypothetical protein
LTGGSVAIKPDFYADDEDPRNFRGPWMFRIVDGLSEKPGGGF